MEGKPLNEALGLLEGGGKWATFGIKCLTYTLGCFSSPKHWKLWWTKHIVILRYATSS